MRRLGREGWVGMALVMLLACVGLWAPAFFEPQPLWTRLASWMPRLVVAAGVAVVMVARHIDISVGSVLGVSGVVGGMVIAAGLPAWAGMAAAVSCGALAGALNGWWVAGLRLPSIVVTLATMVAWREGLRWGRQGVFVNLPDTAVWMGLPMVAGQGLVIAAGLGAVAGLGWWMRNMASGRWVAAMGSNPEAGRLAGIPAGWVTGGTFVVSGSMAGLGAALLLVQSPQVDPASGRLLELEAVAAAVVGGVSIRGGAGRMRGVLAGFLLLACVGPALTYLGVKAYWDKAIHGVVILAAAAMAARAGGKQAT